MLEQFFAGVQQNTPRAGVQIIVSERRNRLTLAKTHCCREQLQTDFSFGKAFPISSLVGIYTTSVKVLNWMYLHIVCLHVLGKIQSSISPVHFYNPTFNVSKSLYPYVCTQKCPVAAICRTSECSKKIPFPIMPLSPND